VRNEAREPYPDQPVLGLELLGGLEVVVDEAEAGRLATSEVGAELEDEDAVGVLDLVNLGQLILEIRLRDTRISLIPRRESPRKKKR
jgi:hypothetical protein